LNQHARLPHQRPQLPAFPDGFARIQAVLQRVFLLPRGAPIPATTMHSATREIEFLVVSLHQSIG
jgi:hypothetical protein